MINRIIEYCAYNRFTVFMFVTAAVLAALVGASRKRLWITNAYFAPNRTAIRLLGEAAQRGVDVRLLMTGHPDKRIAWHAACSYVDELHAVAFGEVALALRATESAGQSAAAAGFRIAPSRNR